MGAAQKKEEQKTPTTEQEFCTVAKVQALWEPKNKKALLELLESKDSKEMKVASWLGLEPVGWIFRYQEDRHKDEDSLPVYAEDVQTGASLQICIMKANQKAEDRGARFVTLAMDGKTGATEAFQLSDVSVQMVAEDMIVVDPKKSGRFAPTRHGIIVDGQETRQLDAVLCLVNTAMLSHEGSFAGSTATMRKTGGLTKKARKSIAKTLKDDEKLLEELCNFHSLVALYNEGLSEQDVEKLCELTRKRARGQKKGTIVDEELKEKLRTMVEVIQ